MPICDENISVGSYSNVTRLSKMIRTISRLSRRSDLHKDLTSWAKFDNKMAPIVALRDVPIADGVCYPHVTLSVDV